MQNNIKITGNEILSLTGKIPTTFTGLLLSESGIKGWLNSGESGRNPEMSGRCCWILASQILAI